MDPEERKKTVFVTPDDKWQYKPLPMGYCDAPYHFQNLVNKMLDGVMYKNCLGYFDDLIAMGNEWEEFLKNSEILLKILRRYGLKAKTSKCKAGVSSTKFLGHIVDGKGIRPNPAKVEAVKIMGYPTKLKELRSALGLFTFMSRYIINYAEKAEPLLRLTRAGGKWQFGKTEKEAFDSIKSSLMNDCMLVHYQEGAKLKLSADASDYAVGGILLQEEEDSGPEGTIEYHYRPVAYYSQTLRKYQRNCTVSEKGLLGILLGIAKYRHYLEGKEFIIETDHHALCQLPTLTFKNGRLNRWALMLQGFRFKVMYKEGKHHIPDCLTRNNEWDHRKPILEEEEIEEMILNIGICEEHEDINIFMDLGMRQHFAEQSDGVRLEPKICQVQVRDYRTQKIREKQRKKAEYRDIIDYLEGEKVEPPPKATTYALHSGVLYKKPGKIYHNKRLVVTEEMMDKIFEDYHSQREGAHFGFVKTYSAISKKFYMEGMPEAVRRRNAECQKCCYYKAASKVYQEPQIKGVSKYPLEKIEMDVVGPLPRSVRGKKYVIVAVDSLTRYTIAKAIGSQETSEVIKFLEELAAKYGLPKSIQTDQGTNFMSTEFADYVLDTNIQHITGDVYHH